MHTVSKFVAITSTAAYAVLSGATSPAAPRAVPGVAVPQQAPVQGPAQSSAATTKAWNVMQAVAQILAQIIAQVIAAVVSAGGWANGADQTELEAAVVDAAITNAVVTTIQQLPDLQNCQQITIMITGFQQQNAAVGKPLPNQLTGVQIQLLIQRVSIIGASNPRLANDLKVLVARLPRS